MKSTCLILVLILFVRLATADILNSNLPATSGASNQPLTALPPAPLIVSIPSVKTETKPVSATLPNEIDYTKYAAIILSVLTLLYTFWKDHKTDARLKEVEEERWTPSFGQENAEIKLDSQALLH